MLFLIKLLEQFGFAQQSPTPAYTDNTACIEWGNNTVNVRELAKHIDIRPTRSSRIGEMRFVRVPTSFQLVDIHTKGLHYKQWQACVEGILSKKDDST